MKSIRTKIKRIIFTFCLVGLFFACDASSANLKDLKINTDLVLTDHNGKSFDIKSKRGKVLWLYFGFTRCPDFCPATHSRLSKAYQMLDYRRKNLEALMVSVDPGYDRPEHLKKYLSYYKDLPSTALTGQPAEIARVASQYGSFFEKIPLKNGDYTVDHSTYVYLIDQNGLVRYLFKYADKPAFIAGATRQILPAF